MISRESALFASLHQETSEVSEDLGGLARGRVYINKTQCFEGVDGDVWEFYIGGYQALHKWLKDRKGRKLSFEGQDPIGFVTVRLVGQATSEMLFLYVKLDRAGTGVGSELVRVAEQWVRKEHPQISQVVVDTVVPHLNKSFYEKLGYKPIGESECPFPDGPVPAIRLGKDLRKTDRT